MSEEKNLPELSKEAQWILDAVKKLSVMDLANLVKHLEEEFWVSAAAPVAVAAAPWAAWWDEWWAEQTEFTVELTAAWSSKIWVIKVVREITWLWLKEAKELVDWAPKAVKEKVSKEEAEEIKAKLTEAWATVEIK